jgi:hypothetical protein
LVEKSPLGFTADNAAEAADNSHSPSLRPGYESGELISAARQIAHDG